LQQQVAEFLAQFGGVGAVDGFQRLVGLFQQVGLEALVGLLAIPGAAVGARSAATTRVNPSKPA
jgi:hypothetical protein